MYRKKGDFEGDVEVAAAADLYSGNESSEDKEAAEVYLPQGQDRVQRNEDASLYSAVLNSGNFPQVSDDYIERCLKCGINTRQKDGVCVLCRTGITKLSRELGPAPDLSHLPGPPARKRIICEICGKPFWGKGQAKYCSNRCRWKGRKTW